MNQKNKNNFTAYLNQGQPQILAKQTLNKPLTSPFSQQFEKNPSDAKLPLYMKTITQLQNSIHFLESQLEYYRNTNSWLENFMLQKTKNSSSKNILGIKPLMSASSRLNILEKQAIQGWKSKDSDHFQKNKDEPTAKSKCNISAHLHQILTGKKQKEYKIEQLLEVRSKLYQKLKKAVQKQQPYIHQKVLTKIQRQISKFKKAETLRHLQSICKQKQSWLAKAKQQVSSQVDQKVIENKVGANLSKMKQVMNKKIANDEYTQFMISPQNVSKNIAKLNNAAQQARLKLANQMGSIEKGRNRDIEQSLQQRKKIQQARLIQFEIDQVFMQELSNSIKQAKQICGSSLGSQKTRELETFWSILSKQLSQKI